MQVMHVHEFNHGLRTCISKKKTNGKGHLRKGKNLMSKKKERDLQKDVTPKHISGQGSKCQISGLYRMWVFHIEYRISGEISGIRAHIGRSYQTLYIMKY